MTSACTWERLAGLELELERVAVEGLALAVSPHWTRRTSVLRFEGAGRVGVGEDVTYAGSDHDALQAGRLTAAGGPPGLGFGGLAGRWRLGDLAAELGRRDLFGRAPGEAKARRYRRWAAESAALGLALAQAGRTLGEVLGRPEDARRPVRFAVSRSLPGPGLEPALAVLAAAPGARLKLDWSEAWDARTLERLAATGRVDVVDLKGHYRGDFQGPPPDAAAYRAVAEALPEALLEDPWLGPWPACDDARLGAALADHRARIAWDAPLVAWRDVARLPFAPRRLNSKPSRFGSLEALAAAYDGAATAGIALYGGGQFELGPGRDQALLLAALFHPDAPNDLAPVAWHGAPRPGLPASPWRADADAFRSQ